MVIVVVQVSSSEENVHEGHEGGFIYSWHVHTSEWTAAGGRRSVLATGGAVVADPRHGLLGLFARLTRSRYLL